MKTHKEMIGELETLLFKIIDAPHGANSVYGCAMDALGVLGELRRSLVHNARGLLDEEISRAKRKLQMELEGALKSGKR